MIAMTRGGEIRLKGAMYGSQCGDLGGNDALLLRREIQLPLLLGVMKAKTKTF